MKGLVHTIAFLPAPLSLSLLAKPPQSSSVEAKAGSAVFGSAQFTKPARSYTVLSHSRLGSVRLGSGKVEESEESECSWSPGGFNSFPFSWAAVRFQKVFFSSLR